MAWDCTFIQVRAVLLAACGGCMLGVLAMGSMVCCGTAHVCHVGNLCTSRQASGLPRHSDVLVDWLQQRTNLAG
jgi:hypothetical protein